MLAVSWQAVNAELGRRICLVRAQLKLCISDAKAVNSAGFIEDRLPLVWQMSKCAQFKRRPKQSLRRESWVRSAVDTVRVISYVCYLHGLVDLANEPDKEETMKWMTPRIVEIAVGLEINSYACAEVK
jgi:coenzyme PQQ precursor peptide PqqA